MGSLSIVRFPVLSDEESDGPIIPRTETAALYSLSVIAHGLFSIPRGLTSPSSVSRLSAKSALSGAGRTPPPVAECYSAARRGFS